MILYMKLTKMFYILLMSVSIASSLKLVLSSSDVFNTAGKSSELSDIEVRARKNITLFELQRKTKMELESEKLLKLDHTSKEEILGIPENIAEDPPQVSNQSSTFDSNSTVNYSKNQNSGTQTISSQFKELQMMRRILDGRFSKIDNSNNFNSLLRIYQAEKQKQAISKILDDMRKQPPNSYLKREFGFGNSNSAVLQSSENSLKFEPKENTYSFDTRQFRPSQFDWKKYDQEISRTNQIIKETDSLRNIKYPNLDFSFVLTLSTPTEATKLKKKVIKLGIKFILVAVLALIVGIIAMIRGCKKKSSRSNRMVSNAVLSQDTVALKSTEKV